MYVIGGPLHSEIQTFIRAAFGIPLVQGYGLTETTAGLSIQADDDIRSGIAGVPLPCCEVKLLSCPDISDKASLPYMSTDTVDNEGNPIFGRGEILVKGLNIGVGYYMMPEKTKEDFDADGFFHTGDIGQFMNDGSLRIVDRKKNLVKLKGGEVGIVKDNITTNSLTILIFKFENSTLPLKAWKAFTETLPLLIQSQVASYATVMETWIVQLPSFNSITPT